MRILSACIACLVLLVAGTSWAADDSRDSFVYEASSSAASCGCDSDCGDCNLCCDCERWFLLPQCDCGINIHGWIDVGIIANDDSPTSNFNGPYNAVDRANEVMANQFYVVAEKGLPQCGIGIGGRVDVLFGNDFFLAESIGMEKHQDGSPHWNSEHYGIALPQAYVSVGREDFNVQIGHFYSIVGYESVMAPSNFFYSKAYSYQFAGPFTHWGAQANYSPNECWDLQIGVHNGWDAFDRPNDRAGVVAKATYHFCRPDTSASFAVATGDEPNDPAQLPGVADDVTNRTRYSLLVNVPFACDWEYVFHHWYGQQVDGAPGQRNSDWYGIDQYLYYTINDCWKAGARFEWFRDVDGTRVGLNRASNPNTTSLPGDFYSFSAGLNWTPTCNLTVRPEVRYDWFDERAAIARRPFDDGNSDSQFMFGIDGIFTF